MLKVDFSVLYFSADNEEAGRRHFSATSYPEAIRKAREKAPDAAILLYLWGGGSSWEGLVHVTEDAG